MYKYYIKKVSKQDVERTTVINNEAQLSFFGVDFVNRDDSEEITIIYLPNNVIDRNVKLIKKQDVRIFIDKERFKENDLLMFERKGDNVFTLSIIDEKDIMYSKLNNYLSNNYMLTDVLNENDEILNQFAKWFIKKEGISHNYFKRTFSNDIKKLLNALKKYESVYYEQFKTKLFDFKLSNIKEFIYQTHNNLYQENGVFFEISKITNRHMPRAILGDKNYLAFLNELEITNSNDDFYVSDFLSLCEKSGLIYSNQLVSRFSASLLTKPFVILTGLSGSGKTKLAQAFAQWICYKEEDGEKNEQYCIVPVGADWTNREPLLGYPNALAKAEYVTPENGVLDLMIRAKQNFENSKEATKPYFLILDEMNLSHVERYFADFLSTMESGSEIPLHKIENESKKIPQSIKLPKNLFIIGTVNIDETTYMFSPKVLDRANTIEFRLTENDLEEFINSDIKLDMDILTAQGANMAESFMKMALLETDKNLKPNAEDLKLFFSELKKSGAEFGYRTASEIGRLMYMLKELGEDGDNLLDIAIMQKLLPKLHGSRSKLNTALTTLAKFCVKEANKDFEGKDDEFRKTYFIPFDKLPQDLLDKIKYKISFEKISRMHKNAIENGFTSYAEA
jgi:5-methylcytosine-specific restriction enzyme B